MPAKSKLIPVSYYDPSKQVRLSAYADTVVYEPERYVCALRAIRFGGYPEMVQAMSDAIYAGGTIDAQIAGQSLCLRAEVKRYDSSTTFGARSQIFSRKAAAASRCILRSSLR